MDATDLWDLVDVDGAASSLDTLGLSLGDLADVARSLSVECRSWNIEKSVG